MILVLRINLMDWLMIFCRDLKMENIMLDDKKKNIKIVGKL